MSLYRGKAALARALEPAPPAVRVRPWGVLAWLVLGLLFVAAVLGW
jgi:hypothetical protein